MTSLLEELGEAAAGFTHCGVFKHGDNGTADPEENTTQADIIFRPAQTATTEADLDITNTTTTVQQNTPTTTKVDTVNTVNTSSAPSSKEAVLSSIRDSFAQFDTTSLALSLQRYGCSDTLTDDLVEYVGLSKRLLRTARFAAKRSSDAVHSALLSKINGADAARNVNRVMGALQELTMLLRAAMHRTVLGMSNETDQQPPQYNSEDVQNQLVRLRSTLFSLEDVITMCSSCVQSDVFTSPLPIGPLNTALRCSVHRMEGVLAEICPARASLECCDRLRAVHEMVVKEHRLFGESCEEQNCAQHEMWIAELKQIHSTALRELSAVESELFGVKKTVPKQCSVSVPDAVPDVVHVVEHVDVEEPRIDHVDEVISIDTTAPTEVLVGFGEVHVAEQVHISRPANSGSLAAPAPPKVFKKTVEREVHEDCASRGAVVRPAPSGLQMDLRSELLDALKKRG